MRTCRTCGKVLEPGKGRPHAYWARRVFCDATCRKNLPKPVCRCQWCGRDYTPVGVRGTKRPAARMFCSNSCAAKGRAPADWTTTHGMSRTTEYRIWVGMRARCNNPNFTHYAFYGGRGIKVCAEWDSKDGGFEAFVAHIGRRPRAGLTVDRIDNTKGYEPGNVQWATRKQQSRNMRSNRHATIGGVTRTVAEWLEVLGIRSQAVYSRLKLGWDPVRALTEPVRPRAA